MEMWWTANSFMALARTSGSLWTSRFLSTSAKLPCFDRCARRCSDLSGRFSTTLIIFLVMMEKQSAVVRIMMTCSWCRIPNLTRSACRAALVVLSTTSSRRLRSAMRACCLGDSSADRPLLLAATDSPFGSGAVPMSHRLNSRSTFTTAILSRSLPFGAMRLVWCFTSERFGAPLEGGPLLPPLLGCTGEAPLPAAARALANEGLRAMTRLCPLFCGFSGAAPLTFLPPPAPCCCCCVLPCSSLTTAAASLACFLSRMRR
mmetsp:Transcript_11726/g.33159  ORF Transcript_11726/g.33159 Transcript_11726/m.33159 type:complete len:260 (+) Transcript_11726:1941-2720(+)